MNSLWKVICTPRRRKMMEASETYDQVGLNVLYVSDAVFYFLTASSSRPCESSLTISFCTLVMAHSGLTRTFPKDEDVKKSHEDQAFDATLHGLSQRSKVIEVLERKMASQGAGNTL